MMQIAASLRHAPLAALLLLAACSGGQDTATTTEAQDLKTFDVQSEPPPPGGAPGAPSQPAAAAPAALPQIAYTYSFGFRLPSNAVADLQERHLDLCDRLGPARCRVVEMKRGSGSGEYVQAALKLQVAAAIARPFGQRLVATAGEAGGETVDRAIAAEDLSKQMVDTAARIRIKEALVDRLTALLATRSGNIAQAVEAERAVNAAQEDLEQARGWLVEMRGRVAMSTIDIGYTSAAPLGGGFADPLRESLGDVGALFSRSLAMLIMLAAGLLPWALLAGLAWWLFRRFRPARRRHLAVEPELAPAPKAEAQGADSGSR